MGGPRRDDTGLAGARSVALGGLGLAGPRDGDAGTPQKGTAGMTEEQWLVLGCAAIALAVGLVLFRGGRQRPAVPPPRVRLELAWLVVAICPVFLIFLFFPDSSVEG